MRIHDREIEENLAKKYEGKLFVHIWVSVVFGNEFHVMKDYYAVVNGKVLIVSDGQNSHTGDTMFNLYKDCKQVGKYDPDKKYLKSFRTYSYSEFKKLHKL